MLTQTRVPCVPLITNDPYFSVWSAHDHLYDGDTTHWAGRRKRIVGTIAIDGLKYCFMGDSKNKNVIPQIGLTITATSTTYTFANEKISLTLRFTSPLLLTDPELVSRPCTYFDFTTASVDGGEHAVSVRLDFYEDHTHDDLSGVEVCGGAYATDSYRYASMGKTQQSPLNHSGDHIGIDWGYLYLASPAAQNDCIRFEKSADWECLISATLSMTANAHKYIVAAYDDLASINYFGDIKKAYWTKFSDSILTAIKKSVGEHDDLIVRCNQLDGEIHDRAVSAIDENYAQICALAYRQSIAAHKLIEDNDGELVFLSKENDSNGCIGTVDISYPSMPLYLLYNTDYIKGMLRPIFKFIDCDVWEYDFAPHDVGRYPYATGQVYGINRAKNDIEYVHGNGKVFPPFYIYPKNSDIYDFAYQMPVEEAGNMLIMTAVVCKLDQTAAFAAPHFDTLEKWTQYLIKFGSDPGSQLCTDDFAGHLEHNVNLSAKAIMGIMSFALLAKQMGKQDVYETYAAKAKEMAADWEKRCITGDHTMLTFDKADSWSLKYNLVWDLFFDTELFSPSIYQNEIDWYIQKTNAYGVPLDSRADYTKSDWILWCTAMTDCKEKRAALVAPIVHYLEDSSSRIAFGDWYNTVSGKYEHFINRSVQGGLFMPILMDQ